MTLLGLGSGYFLWGARVARLTESINGLTLEVDTMRERLAKPQQQDQPNGWRAADELRVINEAIAAFRQELSDQKAMIERNGQVIPADTATVNAELRTVREELAGCIADKRDLEMRAGANPAPSAPPAFAPQQAPAFRPTPPATPEPPPAPPRPPVGSDLSDPRF